MLGCGYPRLAKVAGEGCQHEGGSGTEGNSQAKEGSLLASLPILSSCLSNLILPAQNVLAAAYQTYY